MSALENILKLETARVASEDKAAERFVYPGTPAFKLIMACVEEGFKATLESTDTNTEEIIMENTDKLKVAKAKAEATLLAKANNIEPGSLPYELIMLCVEAGLKEAFRETFESTDTNTEEIIMENTEEITAQDIHESASVLVANELENRHIKWFSDAAQIEQELYDTLIKNADKWAYTDKAEAYEELFDNYFYGVKA